MDPKAGSALSRWFGSGDDEAGLTPGPDDHAAFARHVAFVNAARIQILLGLMVAIDGALALMWLGGRPTFVPSGFVSAGRL